jgi:hypothetical protein
MPLPAWYRSLPFSHGLKKGIHCNLTLKGPGVSHLPSLTCWASSVTAIHRNSPRLAKYWPYISKILCQTNKYHPYQREGPES